MTHPETEVGGDGNPADANPAQPFEDIAAEMLGEEAQEEPAEEAPPTEEEGDEPETDEEAPEEAEDEEDDEPELPAIEPPNSLSAEDKETFKNLPREAQEFTARRIGEIEKGLHTKAQEFAQQKQALHSDALKLFEQVKADTVSQLQKYAQQFEMRPPSADLYRQNPEAYAQQFEAYQYSIAQRDQAQREAEAAKSEQEQLKQAREAQEAEEFHRRLADEVPEALDPTSGQEFLQNLAATAQLLGYDPNNISDVSDFKALKVVSALKAKADKYDSLMNKKMERVRAGKAPPPITKPGTARTPDATQKARADAAWQQAQSAKSRNAKDQALATWMENTGWL